MGCSFGGFYTHIRKHWHSGVLQVRPSQVGKVALCRHEISSPFFRPYLISPQGSPGVQSRPPAVLLMLRMKPELVSFLRSVLCCQCGSRTESAINSPCKHQLNLHSLSFPTLPFSVLQHLFCSLNLLLVSVLVHDGLELSENKKYLSFWPLKNDSGLPVKCNCNIWF